MRAIYSYSLIFCLFFSCSKKELGSTNEPINKTSFTFEDGFTSLEINTNIKAILPSEKSILLSTSTPDKSELVKFNIPSQSKVWTSATWHRERSGTGSYSYHYENVILFRHGHRDFAINLDDGSLRYDVERDDCPDASLIGLGYQYFTRWPVIDEVTQNSKEIVLIGDIRRPDMPSALACPSYDSIGNNGSLGRIMGLHVFENESEEQLLAIRYFDFQPENPYLEDYFAIYNITKKNWVLTKVPLDYHTTGTQSIVANGLVYYGSQSHVSCIDTKSGELKWVTQAYALSPTNLLAFADGSIFIKDHNGMLQRRNAETGELIWESSLGNIQRFIIIRDKLFSIGKKFTITNIENGETLHSFTSPYKDHHPKNYFSKTKKLMGYYDKETKLSHLFLNIDDNLAFFELPD